MRGVSLDEERQSIAITWGPPDLLNETPWRYPSASVGFVFADYSTIPVPHADNCNRCDMIFVPSDFTKTVLQASGVSVPIVVWHHGVYPEEIVPAAALQHTRSAERSEFTFLFVGVAQDRKGISELLLAFSHAFDPQIQDVRLVVKSADWGVIEGWRARYPDPRIQWIHTTLDRNALVDLYRKSDCFVMPTRGEAFCLPLLEAMAQGLPVIYTDYGGHLDFCDGAVGYPVAISGMKPVMQKWQAVSKRYREPPLWAVYDVLALATAMRAAYGDREGCRARGYRAAERAQGWTWTKQAAPAVGALKSVGG